MKTCFLKFAEINFQKISKIDKKTMRKASFGNGLFEVERLRLGNFFEFVQIMCKQ